MTVPMEPTIQAPLIADPSKPVRLKIEYSSPEALIGNLTRGIGRGGLMFQTTRRLPLGTKFIFDLSAKGVPGSVEATGELLKISAMDQERYAIHIGYNPPNERAGVDAVLDAIFRAKRIKRAHPRVPIQVRVADYGATDLAMRLRDISLGGIGIDINSPQPLPQSLDVNARFHFQLKMRLGTLHVQGEVAWTVASSVQGVSHRIGAAFIQPKGENLELLKSIVRLTDLPKPPWVAQISFET